MISGRLVAVCCAAALGVAACGAGDGPVGAERGAVPRSTLFDPFTAPTRSGIDLERLTDAVGTIDGEADCASLPALAVEGVTVVPPPANLNDPDVPLTVAEVVRIVGGCIVVEYVLLGERTVTEVAGLLADEASVQAVGEPARGWETAEEKTIYEGPTGAWGSPVVTAVADPADLSPPIGAYAHLVSREEFSEHRFAAVSTGLSSACGIDTDGRLTCAGEVSKDIGWPIFDTEVERVGGRFVNVAVGGGTVCGLLADRTLRCGGMNEYRQAEPPAGTYQSIALTGTRACALATDGTLVCWGANDYGESDAPDGAYVQFALNGANACAVAAGGTIACWGGDLYGQSDPPPGSYSHVTVGDRHACAITARNTVVCWGSNEFGQADAPEGAYTQLTSGAGHSCALRVDGAVKCWGRNEYNQADAPTGTYTHLAADAWQSCAIDKNGAIVCWGHRGRGRLDAPAGAFTQISIGGLKDARGFGVGSIDGFIGGINCALSVDARAVCWNNYRAEAPDNAGSNATALRKAGDWTHR